MKLSSGKRIGQSGGELAAAAFFSFFLHGIVIAAVLLYAHAAPKKHFPPVYDVKLVGLPAEPTQQLPQAPPVSPPAPPKQEAKALPKEKKAAPKVSRAPQATVKKGAMPELTKAPQKPVTAPESPKPEEPRQEQPAGKITGKTGGQAGPVVAGESVAVTSSTSLQESSKLGNYLDRVRNKISQTWRPPPDAPDAKVRVVFSINRSGWVSQSDVNIDEKNSSGSYQFKLAAIRAILSAKPFPRLPDDFPKQTLELTVDLMAEQ